MYKEIGEKLENIFKELEIGRVKFKELTGVDYMPIRYIINSLKEEKKVSLDTIEKHLYPVIKELSQYGPGYKLFAQKLKETIDEYRGYNDKKANSSNID